MLDVGWEEARSVAGEKFFSDTNRQRLRSSSSALLTVRPTRLVTMGDRAFPVAGTGTLEHSAA